MQVAPGVGWRALRRETALVGGAWIAGADMAVVTNPANDQPVGQVPLLGTAEAERAIRAAQQALPGWAGLLPRERSDILMALYHRVIAETDALATLLTLEQGKPFDDARGEIVYGANFIRWFAEEANRLNGEVIASHLPDRRMTMERVPLGVVGLVTPWNFPSAMLARKAAAALAAGCTAVVVPSMETPFSALALAALAEEAGLPAGVLSVLTGDPATLVGALCGSEIVRGLSFTGSTAIGRLLMAQCAPTIKHVLLELGGHAPFLVLGDADVEVAAEAAVAAKYQTSGQDCLAANRIFVHRSLYEPFLAAFVRDATALRVADGFAPGAELGPLINSRALAKTIEHVEDAVAKGARLLAGGRRAAAGALFYEPTVLADVTPAMRIMHEETFGPVAAILPFDDEAELIAAANATDYGLAAYIYTRDIAKAYRIGAALDYGMLGINTVRMTGAPVPFGGVKQSGLGREGSRHGIEDFTELKYVCLAI